MKKPLLIAAGAVVLAALLVFSIAGGRKPKGTKVYAEEAIRRAITQTVKASGQVQPRTQVNISSHVIGKIEKLHVVEGQAIAAGEPFLELERPAFLAERDHARAQLAKAESEIRQAEIALGDQDVRLARAQRLASEGIAAPETLESAQLNQSAAKLRVEQARESQKQARALLIKAEDDLKKTTIYSPLSGRVIALNAEQGEVVVSGTMNNPASVIGTIADLSEILAEIDVDETEIVHLEVGQPATVRIDALPDKEYRGRVVEIGSSGYAKPAQPDVTFFLVKLLLENADATLRPGMSARADVEVATHPEAVVVPIQSVVEREVKGGGTGESKTTGVRPAAKRQVVYVVDGDRAAERAVRTSISDATHVEISEGLSAGERVVTGPHRSLRKLKDRDAVTVERPEVASDADEVEDAKDKEKD
jgi:HlyD family secretion protein